MPIAGGESVLVTLSCTSSPCPYGSRLRGEAVAWPTGMGASGVGLYGYTADRPVYLPARLANGLTLSVTSGEAAIVSGPASAAHTVRETVGAGQTITIQGITTGDLVSIEGDARFTYAIAGAPEAPVEPTDPVEPTPGPTDPAACYDAVACDVVTATATIWRCAEPGCTYPDWVGSTITWPSWSASATNDRTGNAARRTVSPDGQLVYPYMGAWADGCQVTVVSGEALVVEWVHGANQWRETLLHAGQSHTIDLVAPEDGALVEGGDAGLVVRLTACTPAPLVGQ